MKRFFILFFVSLLPYLSFSQGEGNHWYFGYNCGLDFSNGSPVADINGALSTWEGGSSVSDKNGNLLFYTDGSTVYDRNHSVMPNGTGLLGNSSSTQSAIIVKKPGTDTLYYIFTTPEGSGGAFVYSEVNLLLNGGLGDIVVSSKNTNLMSYVGERVTATKHKNGIDTWIITKRNNTLTFYAYLINCNGVQPPITTDIGINALGDNAGSIVASPDGKKVACTYFSSVTGIEILEFNNVAGTFTNPITQTLSGYPYGACFSPNNKLFYYSNISDGNVTQLDLTAGNGTAVLASATVVGNIAATGPFGFRAGALQLGPDKKIYMAENGQGNISVINNPDVIGTGCNFVGDAINLGGKTSGLGLPAFFLNFLDTTDIDNNSACANSPAFFTFEGDSTVLDSVHWNFGDPASGINNSSTIYNPSHTFSATGNYTIQLIKYFPCGSDTSYKMVMVITNTVTASISGDDSLCAGTALQLTASGGAFYDWSGPGSLTDSVSTINISNPVSGTYTAIVTDSSGCADTINQYVNVFPNPVAVATSNNPVPIGDTIFLTTDTTLGIAWSGPNGFTSSQQNPEIPNAQFSDTGTYQVIKTNVFGCSDTAEVFVSVYQPEIPDNTIDDDGDGLIDCADPDLATLSQCYRCGYDSVAWQAVAPEPDFNRGIAIKYTGFEQHFIVPAGVTAIKIKAWGAGGGGCCFASIAGGAGGYTTDSLTTQTGETFVVVTGEGGWTTRFLNQTARATFGLGGSGNSTGATGTSETSSGGGLSGVFFSTFSQSNARVIAGGGGGSGDVGNSDETPGGNGNNPLAGGYLPLIGENGTGGFGGGGGGYVGGVTGIGRFTPGAVAEAGEAGSGYKYTSGGLIMFSPELNTNPPETTNVHYISGVGLGGMSNTPIGLVGDLKSGGDGLVVIQWFQPIDDLTVTASKSSLCFGDTLSIIAEGPGTYTWSPATTLNSTTSAQVIATPVNDITYQVISNNNNCMDTAQVSITVNLLPGANFGSTTECLGENTLFTDSSNVATGTITNWSWNFGDNSPVVIGNSQTHLYTTCGNFNAQLTVTTNNGCVDSITKAITIHCIPQPDAGFDDTICFAENATLIVSPNGTGYTYSWDSPGNANFSTSYNPNVSPVSTITYTVTLTDSNSCSAVDSVTIYADSEILLSKTLTNVNCNAACNGQIDVAVTGGTAPYLYSWSGSCTTANCNNLCPGTYSLTLTDAWGCIATTDTVVTEPSVLQAFISSFAAASCNTGCDGTAAINASGGTPGFGYIYSWNSTPAQNTSAADSLCAGTYICSVTDANSCVAADTITITAPPAITLLVSVSQTDCNDSTGTAAVSAFGGTPGYTFSWNPGGYNSPVANNLAAGTYTITVTDTNNCIQSGTASVTTVAGQSVIATASDNDIIAGNNTLLNVTGTGTYGWSPNTALNCDTCQSPLASPMETTTYCVVVTDTNNCVDSACITILVEYPCDLTVPNAFSPNTDGSNDVLTLHGWDKCVSEFSIIIFNRWGEKVFESNNPSESWNGGSNDKNLNSAVFVYYIRATLNSGESITRQGNISLIR